MARSRGRHSIRNRLFWLFLCSTMVLLIVVSFMYYQKTTQIIHGKISDLAEKNISQTVGLFDLLLEGYDSVSKSLNSNTELLRLLAERDAEHNSVADSSMERSITNILGAAFYSRDDIVGIHVITNGGNIYTFERRFAGLTNTGYASTDWFRSINEAKGAMVWLGLSNGSLINIMQQDQVFVFGRVLYDLDKYKPIGIVLIETDPEPIKAALSNVTISPNSRVYIVDKNNHIVASTQPDGQHAPSFDGLPRPLEGEIVVDNQTDQLIVSAKAAVAEWTVFGLTPKADMNAELEQARLYLLFVIVAVILLSILLASLISRNLSSPLKLLIREMKQVELGNFRASVKVNSFDEINSLVASFNRMVQRMDELIEGITLASISEKNAQLQALQSQVNPHFLFNTLDMIYWMLDERENDQLCEVILALSHMFRYSSDWEEASRTTLSQELEQMTHYLTIIETRLDGRVQTEIDIGSEWNTVILPKMTLQPIIENAVKSGLEPLSRPGMLRVYAEADEAVRELRIVVADNGVGMEDSTLIELQGLLGGSGSDHPASLQGWETSIGERASAESGDNRTANNLQTDEAELEAASSSDGARTRKGIGLPNVHRRIQLMYGEPYGLRIDSKLGEGTTVKIVLPLPAVGEPDEGYSECD